MNKLICGISVAVTVGVVKKVNENTKKKSSRRFVSSNNDQLARERANEDFRLFMENAELAHQHMMDAHNTAMSNHQQFMNMF